VIQQRRQGRQETGQLHGVTHRSRSPRCSHHSGRCDTLTFRASTGP
jgi:hypothetical protein